MKRFKMTDKEEIDFVHFWNEWSEVMDYAKSITQPDEDGEKTIYLQNGMMIAAYAIYLHEQRKNRKNKNRNEDK